jgi:hypothetical protein
MFLLGAWGIAGVTGAHHSARMFAETPLWVTGTIVRYRPVDPHVMLELEERSADGKPRRWIVEGPRMARLERILQANGGVPAREFLAVGDVISVCGFFLKSEFDPARMYADWRPDEKRFVHGQVLARKDAVLQSWGPYGKIDNCVRAGDSSGTWVQFLDRNPLARRQWCDSQSYDLPDVAPRAFLDAVNRGLATPCTP